MGLKEDEELAARGANAPRVAVSSIEDKIAHKIFTRGIDLVSDEAQRSALDEATQHQLEILTVCTLVMKNGFTVMGKSAPASPENFDVEKGRTFAYEHAVREAWQLEGYLLREQLHNA